MASRRDFLSVALASGAALTLSRFARAGQAESGKGGKGGKKILILGGTSFVGPACTEAALARGHTVTLFNRGRIESKRKEKGRPSAVPEGVEVLYGNRDPNLTADDWKKDPEKDGPKDPNSPKGLSQLEGKKWDAVIDTSGFFPRMVKASAELLAPNVSQYLFISTVSVYKNNDKPGEDESGELATLADPTTESMGARFENYGGGKVLCEQAAEKAMPGRVANVRPGFIVGPRDTSARFIYWPLRISKGGEMAIPGTPEDPIQIIDVRDLAEFCVHLIETNTNGAFNATGPQKPLTMREMVEGCKKGVGGDAAFTWIDPEFCEKHGVEPGEFQLWIPPKGETAGFHSRDVSRGVKAGMKFRPVDETAKATLDWYRSLPEDIQKNVAKLVDPEKETALLEAWKNRTSSPAKG